MERFEKRKKEKEPDAFYCMRDGGDEIDRDKR